MTDDSLTEPRGFDRRKFLALLGATGAAAALQSGLATRWLDLDAVAAAAPPVDPWFPFGVASGDPRPDGTVIWTAVAASLDGGTGVPVQWEVAADPEFATVLASGTGSYAASAATDHTFSTTVTGLDADGWYHYRFRAAGHQSRTGRFRTAPAPGSSPDRLRFAFCSCQQINDSYYVAHAAMAAEDLDFVVHYGDYVYVSDGGTLTLDDYRAVYRRFKANPLLQELHATYPMVVMWDDGEFVNGVDATTDPVRTAAARQAWFEYMPVARNPEEPGRAYRAFEWGDLVDFLLLDVRQYRSAFVPPNDTGGILSTTDTAKPGGDVIFDPDRTCLGAAQKAWFTERIARPGHRWRHVGQGYQFMALRLATYDTPELRADPPPGFHVNGGKYFSTELWDGYWAERRELMDFLAAEKVPNVIVTAGHTHIYFSGRLRPDYDDLANSPIVAHEFVCGSLTADPDPRSQFFPDLPPDEAEKEIHKLEGFFRYLNPHADYIDLLNQGYGIVTFTPERAVVDFRVIDTFDEQATPSTAESFTVEGGALPEPPDSGSTTTTTGPPSTTPASTTGTPTAPTAVPVDTAANFTG